MIQLILNVNRGFACWPFYVIPRWCVGTQREAAYIEHEVTHCRRQKWITPFWWIAWVASRKFRWKEESEAYRRELMVVKEHGEVNLDYYARELSKGYLGMIDYHAAYSWLVRTIS